MDSIKIICRCPVCDFLVDDVIVLDNDDKDLGWYYTCDSCNEIILDYTKGDNNNG